MLKIIVITMVMILMMMQMYFIVMWLTWSEMCFATVTLLRMSKQSCRWKQNLRWWWSDHKFLWMHFKDSFYGLVPETFSALNVVFRQWDLTEGHWVLHQWPKKAKIIKKDFEEWELLTNQACKPLSYASLKQNRIKNWEDLWEGMLLHSFSVEVSHSLLTKT